MAGTDPRRFLKSELEPVGEGRSHEGMVAACGGKDSFLVEARGRCQTRLTRECFARDASLRKQTHLTLREATRGFSQAVDFLDCGVDISQVNPYTPLVR